MADQKLTELAEIGTLDAADIFYVVDDVAGTPVSNKVTGTELHGFTRNPLTNNTEALGTTALGWADLHLGTGGVLNWANGTITVTESSDVLAFAGGQSYTFDEEITPDANDGAALGTTALMWSDLFLASGAVVNYNNGDITITHSADTLSVAGVRLIKSHAQYSADAVSSDFFFDKSRNGTVGSHTVVQDGDDLGKIIFRGSDGTNFENAAQILAEVDGSPGNNDMPGRISLWTTTDAGTTLAERVRVDAAGRVHIGAGAVPNTLFAFQPALSVNGTGSGHFAIGHWAADANGPTIISTKSRNATIGSHTVVQDGDNLGGYFWGGSDGDEFIAAAQIAANVDGSPGNGDMPGRLTFSTTADGGSSVTERLRINSAGRIIALTSGQVAHFWVYWTANSTTILASHNVTSIDDDSTGDAGINLTTGFSSNNFAAFVQTNDTTNGWDGEEVQASGINVHTASTVDVLCSTITDGTTAATNLTDPDQWQACGFGVSA